VILVDTSVWVDFFNGVATAESDYLSSILGSEPVAIGDLILTEVLQGFRSDRDHRTARSLLGSLTVFELLNPDRDFDPMVEHLGLRSALPH
jgi:predicted nucleic acid-binding protein